MSTVVVCHDLSIVAESLRDTDAELTVVEAPDAERAVAALGDAEILVVNPGRWEDALLEGLSTGDWVQSTSAGYDAFPLAAFAERGVCYTNAAGNYGPVVAEHAFALAFAHSRRLFDLRARQREARWDRSIGTDLGDWVDARLTVVGVGRIGGAIAERGRAFSMSVSGVVRDPDGYDGPPLDRVVGPEGLADLLPETDLLVLAVPLTDETRGLIDAAALAALPRSAILVNVARGPVVDEAALVEALAADELAGAGLDVAESEPLAPDSPLWGRDDVLLTPHVAGRSASFGDRFAALFVENHDRRRAGEAMTNVIV
jgi:D-2-hydroxyacid dehydrogenase (NADP+)